MPYDAGEMQRLLDEFREAEVFERASLREIAKAWCAYQATKDDQYWWAVALLWTDAYLGDRTRREQLIELIVEVAPTDDVLGIAAAGPLEDAIYDADECVAWLEGRTTSSSRFRQALGQVWIWRQVSPERFAQIERATGRPLARPKS